MRQEERRRYLIEELLAEDMRFSVQKIPEGEEEQKNLLRALMNVREAKPIGRDFLQLQDEYLQEELRESCVQELADLMPCKRDERIYLYQGDMTRLRCDAITNPANSGLCGCFRPLHNCLDNLIHTRAGIQLRLRCDAIMRQQGVPEPTGKAKITRAYNLPAKYVLHTVGPIVDGPLTRQMEEDLASCYRSCLRLAEEHGLESIAFCCISTGVFHFPNERAGQIAVTTVCDYLRSHKSKIKVIFNVYLDKDRQIYEKLLG